MTELQTMSLLEPPIEALNRAEEAIRIWTIQCARTAAELLAIAERQHERIGELVAEIEVLRAALERHRGATVN